MPTDNNVSAHRAKVQIRRAVLEHVKPARVFDAFCGEGVMFREVWKDAAEYIGCDQRDWSPQETIRRFVADNQRVLRCIELDRFNIFDLDAFGSPWEQALIIAARRRWKAGERGGLVVTDGDLLRMGIHAHGTRQLLGLQMRRNRTGGDFFAGADTRMIDVLIGRWCERSGVRLLKAWGATNLHGGDGRLRAGGKCFYRSAVFEGR